MERVAEWLARVVGVALVGVVAAIPAALWVLGLGAVRSQTGWDYVIPRNDPSLSGGHPAPPWTLADWLPVVAIEIGAFTVVVGGLTMIARFLTPPRHRVDGDRRWPFAWRVGVWAWAGGITAMSVYAAAMHVYNWHEWHALLDSNINIPYHYQLSQAPVGAAVMIVLGLLPWLLVRWLRRRGVLSQAMWGVRPRCHTRTEANRPIGCGRRFQASGTSSAREA